jgi:hypothetical protein
MNKKEINKNWFENLIEFLGFLTFVFLVAIVFGFGLTFGVDIYTKLFLN